MPRRQKRNKHRSGGIGIGETGNPLSTPLLSRDDQAGQGATAPSSSSSGSHPGAIENAVFLSKQKPLSSAKDALEGNAISSGTNQSSRTNSSSELDAKKSKRMSLEAKSIMTLSLLVVTIGSTACIASFGATFFVEQLLTLPALVWTAAGFGTVVAGVSVVNEVRISKSSKKRQIVNALRDEVDTVTSENTKMEASISNMQKQVKRTKNVEKRLQNIVGRQGANVDQLVNLVKENQVVVREMTKCVKARAMQQLINIVIRTDQSRDFKIDDSEIEIMLTRLRQVEYLNFDEDLFRREMRRDNSVSGVIKLIKTLITDEWKLPDNQTGMSFIFNVSQDRRGSLVKAPSSRGVGLPDIHLLETIAEDAERQRHR